MRRSPRPGVVVTAVSVAVSFLTVCVPGAVSAHGAVPAASGSGNATWAYGTVRTASSSGQGGDYAYVATSTAGFAVVLNETPTAPGSYNLDVQRTMGLVLSVEYCRPNCHDPLETAKVGFHAWESLNANLGLTTATVTVNGSLLPAVGLSTSNLTASAGLQLTSSVHLDGSLYSSRNATGLLSTTTSTTFFPVLGLVPSDVTNDIAGTLTNGEQWNSSSNYSESGSATWSLSDLRTGPVPANVSRSGEFTLNASGPIALSGVDPGTTVTLGGATFGVLNLTVTKGPFALREGFLLVPEGANLFGTAAPGWLSSNTNDTGSASVSQANFDVARGDLYGSAHVGFEASGMWWTSATDNPATEATSVPGFLPAASDKPAGGSNATYLQGAPESVGQATSDQNCLATALSCPGAGTPRGPLGLLLIAGASAVVVILLAVLVAERRRVPPPKYPNASLYPPGASPGTAAPPRRPPTRPSGSSDDDPLSHLW